MSHSTPESVHTPDDDDQPDENYSCFTCLSDSEHVDVEQRIQVDVVCAFVAAGADFNDAKVRDEICDCYHDELTAFYSREQAQQR